jgi:hypothetical protein
MSEETVRLRERLSQAATAGVASTNATILAGTTRMDAQTRLLDASVSFHRLDFRQPKLVTFRMI